MPASEVVRRVESRKEVEDQRHPLRGDYKIKHRSNQHKKQQQPEFRIDLSHSASGGKEVPS